MTETIHEIQYLAHCYSLIEQQCEWGKRENWKNSNFEELSFRISQKSGVQISPGTLKRIYGKVRTKEGYQPQQATKDALAIYLDYKDWNDFKSKQKENAPKKQVHINREHPIRNRRKKLNKRNLRLIITNILVVLLLFVIYIKVKQWQQNSSIEFAGKHLAGKAYHTAYFNYDITGINEEIILDFGDGNTEVLAPDKKTTSNYYMLPDNYHVKLIKNGQIIEDTFVYLATSGWEVYANELVTPKPRFFPIKNFPILSNGALTTNSNDVKNSGVDTNEIYWTHFCNMQDFNCSGDNFTFTTSIKNEQEIVAVRCNHIRIDVIGEKGRVSLYFLKSGCTQWVELTFGEILINGKENDLTVFGKDFSDWRKVKIVNEDQKVSIYYEDELIYAAVYQQSIGNIVGLKYSFTGCGAVQSVSVHNSYNENVYHDNFLIKNNSLMKLKPHHIIDIISGHGNDYTYEPHPYGHSQHIVAEKILNNPEMEIQLIADADAICEGCKHLSPDGKCKDVLSQLDPAPSKQEYNYNLDMKLFEYLNIEMGSKMSMRKYLEIVNTKIPGIVTICTHPGQDPQEKLENLTKGLTKLGIREME